MPGSVIQILVAAESGAETTNLPDAQLDAGKGIVGDRHYNTSPDDQVTLVDADALACVNAAEGWQLTPEDVRRNIVTTGVDLNQWETSRFRVGDALLEGVELCEPCAYLGDRLQTATRTPAALVKALTHLGGLRARVIEGAIIKPGDSVTND